MHPNDKYALGERSQGHYKHMYRACKPFQKHWKLTCMCISNWNLVEHESGEKLEPNSNILHSWHQPCQTSIVKERNMKVACDFEALGEMLVYLQGSSTIYLADPLITSEFLSFMYYSSRGEEESIVSQSL
jgi:hypothetical protein